MDKKRIIKYFAIGLAVFFIVLLIINLRKVLYSTYTFGDKRVSITVFNQYKKYNDDRKNTELSLYNSELETFIISRTLPDEFWSSGDMLAACDEYVRTISAMYYDRDIKNVSVDTIKIDGVEVGRVNLTASKIKSSYKATALLFPKEYKNLIIEIYGDEEILTKKGNEANTIINGIKINK